VPGRSGRTWAALLAPSARTSTRRPASAERYSASRSNLVARMLPAGTPSPRKQFTEHGLGIARSPAVIEAGIELAVGEASPGQVGRMDG